MRQNHKKISIIKSNCIISERKDINEAIPEEDKSCINQYLKINKIKYKKKINNCDAKLKELVELYLNEYIKDFDNNFKYYYVKYNNIYKIKFKEKDIRLILLNLNVLSKNVNQKEN